MCGRWLIPNSVALVTAALVVTPTGNAWLCVILRGCGLCA